MAQPPIIPRDILFGNPERTQPRLSADGKFMTYLAPDDRDVLQIWLLDLQAGPNPQPRKITDDPKRGIRIYNWAFDCQHVLYLQDSDGDENFHVYAVDITSESIDARDLTPYEGVKATEPETDHKFPDEFLVALNLRSREAFDMHRVKISTGEVTLVAENPGNILHWTSDQQLNVRAALGATEDGGSDLLLRKNADDAFETVLHFGPDEEGHPYFFSNDGKTLHILSTLDTNAARLIAWDIDSGQQKVLAEDSKYDVAGVMTHPSTREIQAVAFTRDRLTWQFMDQAVEADFAELAKLRDGEIDITSRDLADEVWLVAIVTDDGPVYYYRYDRASKQADFLFTHQPALAELELAKMQPICFTSRDGLEIHGYLSLPIGIEPKNLPTVLNVHGGPWARDTWGYRSDVQWLANRGYAVLQLNYRGSTGYGKAHLNAGNRQWSLKMHDDLIDGVEWIKSKGIADPNRIAIFGGSYGGYATLVGLTKTPEVFAAGVDIVGPSSILTLMETIPPYWKPMMKMFQHRVGDAEADREMLQAASPLNHVDAICRPLLIGQGANDPRVKQSESDQIVSSMRAKDIPVEYVVYSDEGHGFARPENRMHFFAIAENFLAKHLAGRAEPVTETTGHSGEIR